MKKRALEMVLSDRTDDEEVGLLVGSPRCVVFETWKAAHTNAVRYARSLGREVGLERIVDLDRSEKFRVFSLPDPENRTGHELRCEIVRPDDSL